MAVRFDASGDGLVRMRVCRDAHDVFSHGLVQDYDGPELVQHLIALDENGDGALCQTATNGTTLVLFTESSATKGVRTDGRDLVSHHADRRDRDLSDSLSERGPGYSGCAWTFTPAGMYIGNDSIDEFLNGFAVT